MLLHEFVFSSLADLYLKKKFHHWQCLQTCLRIVCLACRAGPMGCLGKYEVSLALILQDQLLDSDIPQCPRFFFFFLNLSKLPKVMGLILHLNCTRRGGAI